MSCWVQVQKSEYMKEPALSQILQCFSATDELSSVRFY